MQDRQDKKQKSTPFFRLTGCRSGTGFILNILSILSILLIVVSHGTLISRVTLCEPFLPPQPGM